MTDRDEVDEKIIAIPFGDPQYNGYKDIQELPNHILSELKHFLTVYKELENKVVKVLQVGSCEQAKKTITECIVNFEKTFK